MSVRSFIYSALTGDAQLAQMIGDRVFPKKSMRSSVEDTPFIVYKLGTDTNSDLAEDQEVHTQFFQIWVHDYTDSESGDYLRIDSIIAEVRRIFRLASSKEHRIIAIRYLETSQDLDDSTLGTVLKYLRFQAVVKGPS